MAGRHFLTLFDLSPSEFRHLISRSTELKSMLRRGVQHQPLRGKVLAMIFEKSSTRTRVSFETGMTQLGGHALFLSPHDTHLGRGEPVEDTARVISRMVDGIMVRTFSHETLERFAQYSEVPVINGLSDKDHPCQLLADMQTWFEHRGDIKGHTVAWIGDGNNMCHSYINAARLLEFKMRIACPEGYDPDPGVVASAPGRVTITRDPREATTNADLIVTDAWVSMGQEGEESERIAAFARYQVDAALMQSASEDALFMHCLPAYRGKEVSAEVLEGTQSLVWKEAENRLHAQKALLEMLLAEPSQ